MLQESKFSDKNKLFADFGLFLYLQFILRHFLIECYITSLHFLPLILSELNLTVKYLALWENRITFMCFIHVTNRCFRSSNHPFYVINFRFPCRSKNMETLSIKCTSKYSFIWEFGNRHPMVTIDHEKRDASSSSNYQGYLGSGGKKN